MRKLLITLLALTSQSASQEPECDVDLPIETAQEAECLIATYVLAQSCLSPFGYAREISESFSRWGVLIRDLNPNPNKDCPILHLAICKKTGEILYSPSSDTCAI